MLGVNLPSYCHGCPVGAMAAQMVATAEVHFPNSVRVSVCNIAASGSSVLLMSPGFLET